MDRLPLTRSEQILKISVIVFAGEVVSVGSALSRLRERQVLRLSRELRRRDKALLSLPPEIPRCFVINDGEDDSFVPSRLRELRLATEKPGRVLALVGEDRATQIPLRSVELRCRKGSSELQQSVAADLLCEAQVRRGFVTHRRDLVRYPCRPPSQQAFRWSSIPTGEVGHRSVCNERRLYLGEVEEDRYLQMQHGGI